MATTTSVFIKAEFRESRGQTVATINWPRPEAATVLVKLVVNGSIVSVEERWAVSQSSVAAIQRMIALLPRGNDSQDGDYMLHIDRGQQSADVRWPHEGEPEPFRRIRLEFERLGHLGYMEAEAFREAGRRLSQNGSLREAIRCYRAGLKALGSSYADPAKVIDDTGMKLVLADTDEKAGRLEPATSIFGRVLDSRMTLYGSRFGLAKRAE